ncbi:activator-dependent family glycosyltransferase [Streptomyces griseus]|uniref:activator-dependent family glycosyltransferase n=1 Tax=Streptomyces griseus TaxID=1911 RepID=UPI000562F2EB|nr:activator-dependent family glycosyltransferase [Streptomyces griseus]
MRVLFATFAAKSHMHAQVSLAWALRTAGHEVRVASQPDLAEAITQAGLTAVPVGDPLELDEQESRRQDETPSHAPEGAEAEAWEEAADGGHPGAADFEYWTDMSEIRPDRLTDEYVRGVFTVMTSMVFQNICPPRMVDDLVAYARWWKPDLVLWDTMTFAGPVAARASGAAHARLLFALDQVGRMRATHVQLLAERPPELRDDPLAEWLGAEFRRFGLDFTEDAVVGQWTVDPVPPSLRFAVDLPSVPVRYIPYNGRASVPDWLREPAERPRVCLTLGLAKREVRGVDKAPIVGLLESVADLDIEVVATLDTGQLKSLPKLPDNVRAVDFVPLDVLLPTCSAIVHHGGSGTFQTALAHGVPQLIVPDFVWDTIHKAYALERRGAGLYVRDVHRLADGELRSLLLRLLREPSFAENAGRLRTEMRGTPGPNDIVPVLERLTAEHRRPVA